MGQPIILKSLAKHGGWQLFAEYTLKFLGSFITMGLIASQLGPSDFSSLIFIINAALWISLVFSLGLDRAILTSSVDRMSLLKISLVLTLVKVSLLALLALAIGQTSPKLQLAALLAIGMSYEFLDYSFRRDERFDVGVSARMQSNVVAITLRMAVLLLEVGDLTFYVATYFVEYLFAFLLLFRKVRSDLSGDSAGRRRKPIEWQYVPSLVKVGTPVMITSAAMFLINYWPSLVGGLCFGLQDVGIFIMAQKICDSMNLAQNAYHQSAAPRAVALSQKIESGNLYELRLMIRNGLITGAVAAIVIYALSFGYVTYILGEEYIAVFSVIPLLLFGQLVSIWSGVRTNVLLGMNKSLVDLYIVLLSLILVLLFFLLVSAMGWFENNGILLMTIGVLFGKIAVAFIAPLFFQTGRTIVFAQLTCLYRIKN